MIKEHDCVVLREDIPAEGVQGRDVGTVVHLAADGLAYEAEFMTLTGQPVAVATVEARQVRPVAARDLSHARPLAEPNGVAVHENPPEYER
jgi:hypothetical protein